MDKFRVEVLRSTPNPQQTIWSAMHQDYCEDFVWEQREEFPDEQKAGELVVKHLLAGGRGHYGPIEHPQIVFNVGYFPHSLMQQIRTHRVGVSFDVQCLGGETAIALINSRTGEYYTKSIQTLYEIWTADPTALDEANFVVFNETTKTFTTGSLQSVMCSGVQPLYRLHLENHPSLDCTVNHRLYTTEGWQTMSQAIGLDAAQTDSDSKVEMTKPCQLWTRDAKNEPMAIAVVAVEAIGPSVTYDIEMQGEWHNFLANDLVVHNSFRYTGQRIVDVALGERDVEDVFYLRPVGNYDNRQGKKYFYSPEQRDEDKAWCIAACERYQTRINEGLAEEHARSLIPFDARQHFVMSCNVRSLMHLLDLRWKRDAQLEAQKLCELMYDHFVEWCPEIAAWYDKNRAKKARLSP
ncbi:MAG: FAD-dependent thymidylate synthase [Limnothrix sp.]